MKDNLIPMGLVLFIVLFVVSMVHTARKQRAAKQNAFKDLARREGFHYREQDDGTAQTFAKDFDGIGRFHSPSLGNVIPKDVVTGTMNGSHAVVFRHAIRYAEGWKREWFVAGLRQHRAIAHQCAVQFCKKREDKSVMHLPDPVLEEIQVGTFNMVVRAPDRARAGRLIDDGVLKQLAGFAGELSFRPEMQVRGDRLIAYLADRNATIDSVEVLQELVEFAEKTATVLAANG